LAYLLHRRPGHQAPARTAVPLAGSFVIGVEEIAVERMGAPVSGIGRAQDERFEEPARVREVPFGRAGVRHRLDHLVLHRKRTAELLGERAHLPVAVGQAAGPRQGRSSPAVTGFLEAHDTPLHPSYAAAGT